MVRLLLVRHGETAWNSAGRFQGHSDVPLSLTGQRQAWALARLLAAEPVRALYTSDLQRARETAQRIADALGMAPQPEPRLREMAFGHWEGLTFAEVQQRDPQTLAAWQADPGRVAPPQGETLSQVADRVGAAFHSIVSLGQEQTVLLVAHGGPLRVLLCLALGLAAHAYWQFTITPGSLSELQVYAQGAILTRLNDTHHFHEASDDG